MPELILKISELIAGASLIEFLCCLLALSDSNSDVIAGSGVIYYFYQEHLLWEGWPVYKTKNNQNIARNFSSQSEQSGSQELNLLLQVYKPRDKDNKDF